MEVTLTPKLTKELEPEPTPRHRPRARATSPYRASQRIRPGSLLRPEAGTYHQVYAVGAALSHAR